MQVSGSIFAVKDNYFEYARNLKYSNANFLHIDLFTTSDNFKLKDILKFGKEYLPLDVHLIYEKITEEDIDILNQSNTQFLNIQYENLENKQQIIEISKKFNGNFGIAITEKTEIEVLSIYINNISQVLIMCSEPGISGAKFAESNYERIRQIKERYPNLKIFADGGIDNRIAEEMNLLGVSMIVSGSYLANRASELGRSIYSLRYASEQDIKVTRNMIKKQQLPMVDKKAKFIDVIDCMSRYRLGIVFVETGEKFEGIITDGDIRKGYLNYKQEVFKLEAEKLMNASPFVIQKDMNMEELFVLLSKKHKGIEVVPIMEGNVLIGAIDLHIGL